jgi:hypothetical protein
VFAASILEEFTFFLRWNFSFKFHSVFRNVSFERCNGINSVAARNNGIQAPGIADCDYLERLFPLLPEISTITRALSSHIAIVR